MLHPGDYPSQFYDEEDDERDVNSAVKTALTVLGKVHSMISFISDRLTLRLSNSCRCTIWYILSYLHTFIITTAGSIIAVIVVISAVFVFVKRRRLGNAFRHRRMAENLVGGNPNYPGHMYLPTADQVSYSKLLNQYLVSQ